MYILGWIVFGLIGGIVAKLLMSGRDPEGAGVTIVMAVIGAFLEGSRGRAIVRYPPGDPVGFVRDDRRQHPVPGFARWPAPPGDASCLPSDSRPSVRRRVGSVRVESAMARTTARRSAAVRTALYGVYQAVREVIAPRLKYSQYLYEDALQSHVRRGTRWLDLGCGHQILPSWRAHEEERIVNRSRVIVGLDYDLPSLQKHKTIRRKVRADVTRLPFGDGTFDLATANMVVEHLDDPRAQFAEINRVLTPGGRFIFHTPNALGYFTMLARVVPRAVKLKFVYLLDGRTADDVFPAFYRANSRWRIEELARATGLRVEEFRLIVSDAMFAPVPPLAVLELLWLRLLMTRPLRPLRTNIIAVLTKEPDGTPGVPSG